MRQKARKSQCGGKRKGQKEKARREKGGEEKKAMVALLDLFIMATSEKKLIDGRSPFGSNVFKHLARYRRRTISNYSH